MDGLTMREPDDARRIEEVAPHEDDSDVEHIAGGGIMSEGGTAVDRGTGTMSGTAQGPDAGEDVGGRDDDEMRLADTEVGRYPRGDGGEPGSTPDVRRP